MSKQQKKFQKKKEREKAVRKKMLRRRELIRAEAKEKREEEMRLESEYELKNGKPQPIIMDPAKKIEHEARRAAMVEERLKKNLEILEALEAEYDQEHEKREEANKVLEDEGHKTIKEKMQALYEKTLKFKESVEETRKDLAEMADEPSGIEKISTGLREMACGKCCEHDMPQANLSTEYVEAAKISKEGEEIVRDELGCTTTENIPEENPEK